jgi:hypothetical protein
MTEESWIHNALQKMDVKFLSSLALSNKYWSILVRCWKSIWRLFYFKLLICFSRIKAWSVIFNKNCNNCFRKFVDVLLYLGYYLTRVIILRNFFYYKWFPKAWKKYTVIIVRSRSAFFCDTPPLPFFSRSSTFPIITIFEVVLHRSRWVSYWDCCSRVVYQYDNLSIAHEPYGHTEGKVRRRGIYE